jgi:hypothetical protein
MEIKMVRGVKDGCAYEKIYLNGTEYPYHMASRLLTNTTGEDGLGIFQQYSRFRKGNMHQEFTFEPLGEFGSDEFTKKLCDRIKTVREWVKSIDYEKQTVFQVPDEP